MSIPQPSDPKRPKAFEDLSDERSVLHGRCVRSSAERGRAFGSRSFLLLPVLAILLMGAGCAQATRTPVPLTPGTPDEVEMGGGLVDMPVVRMTEKGFEPQTLTVSKGADVLFVNEGTRAMYPAAGPHPNHDDYPEFDPKQDIPPGQLWNFTFDKIGTWNYHDHNDEDLNGTVIVTE